MDGVCTLNEGESFHVYLCMNLHIHIPNFRNKNPLSITVDVSILEFAPSQVPFFILLAILAGVISTSASIYSHRVKIGLV